MSDSKGLLVMMWIHVQTICFIGMRARRFKVRLAQRYSSPGLGNSNHENEASINTGDRPVSIMYAKAEVEKKALRKGRVRC